MDLLSSPISVSTIFPYRDAKRQMSGDLEALTSGLESERSENAADLVGGLNILGSSA